MSAFVTPLTLGGLGDLSAHTRRCVFWEIDPAVAQQTNSFSDPIFEKEAWLSMVMLEWGSCGQVATVDGIPAGCALYAPPSAVPRSSLFPTAPVSPDAVLLTTLSVESRYAESTATGGLADDLVKAVVADLVRRGVRALEAFGLRSEVPLLQARSVEDPGVRSASASLTEMSIIDQPTATGSRVCSEANCMIQADFLEDVGFKVIAPHQRYPRLRLELDTNHGWKEDVERALDQLLAQANLTPAKAGVS